MAISDEIQTLAEKVAQVKEHLLTEEATKMALVVPFIYKVLGYDVGNPTEVVPEHNADFRDGTCDKVDYAIYLNGHPVIFFECKWSGSLLEKKYINQLKKYFGACLPARVGVLTNGIQYWFFSDLVHPNVMDDRPFLEFDMNSPREAVIPELKKLTKVEFDPIAFTEVARALKDTKEIKTLIDAEFSKPSDDFVKFFARKVYPAGKQITAGVLERFKPLTEQAINQHLDDRMQEIWRRGKEPNVQTPPADSVPSPIEPIPPTADEMDAYHIVRAILCQSVSPNKVLYKDLKKGFTVMFESTWKPICRLYFDKEPKEIGIFDGNKVEIRQAIQQPSDIYRFGEELRGVVAHYLNKPAANSSHVEESETSGE